MSAARLARVENSQTYSQTCREGAHWAPSLGCWPTAVVGLAVWRLSLPRCEVSLLRDQDVGVAPLHALRRLGIRRSVNPTSPADSAVVPLVLQHPITPFPVHWASPSCPNPWAALLPQRDNIPIRGMCKEPDGIHSEETLVQTR